jgi:hypothetical protein
MKKDKYARIKSEEEIRKIAYQDGSEFVIDPCVITKEMFKYCGDIYKIVHYEESDQTCILDLGTPEDLWWPMSILEDPESNKELYDKIKKYDIYKFGDLFVKVDHSTKTILPEFFSTKEEALLN